jgi:hypothetical protein
MIDNVQIINSKTFEASSEEDFELEICENPI